MVCREDVVAVGLRSNRGGETLGQLVDDSIEVEANHGDQVVLRASDRASDNRVRGKGDPGSLKKGRESLGVAEVVEEARVGLRGFSADVRLCAAVIQNDREPPSARLAVRGKLGEQRDRIGYEWEHVREDQDIERFALAGKRC